MVRKPPRGVRKSEIPCPGNAGLLSPVGLGRVWVAHVPAVQLAAALAQRIVPALLGPRDEAVERDRHVAGGVGHQHLSDVVAGCVAPIYSNHIRHRGSTSLMRVDKLCVGGGSAFGRSAWIPVPESHRTASRYASAPIHQDRPFEVSVTA